MLLHWLGHSSFLIEGKKRVVLDPFDGIGIPFPNVSADIVTLSHGHGDHAASHLVGDRPVVLAKEGRFEEGGAVIIAYPSFHDDASGAKRGENLIFSIEMEGFRIVHLGDLGAEPKEDVMGAIAEADLLLLPVGGNYTICGPQAAELLKKLRPKAAIPMHYKIEGSQVAIASPEAFLSAVGRYERLAGGTLPLEKGLSGVKLFGAPAQA
ncbi:MAG: MBL fold metallo-hydrolase [Christensenellaceae bacterium]|jgi:L-ascorbate metabolism protein UlaG (beta-lactamase superfamily)|nr:MBL fold metallo-hydrolase [Christensenellaceae bacterium]